MKEILLLHGALGSKEQFAKLEEALSVNFKVHTLNFSGHGRRPSHHHSFTIQNFAHEVLDWMNEHYIKTIDVFGYSMGGYVALWLARFYPDRIEKVFTLGTKLRWNTEEAEKEINLLNPEKVFEKVPAFAQALAETHGEHEWKSVMSKTAALMKDLGHTHLTEQDFAAIQQPVLLGLGEKDNMVTQEETDYAHRLLKNSQMKIFTGVQHPIEKIPVPLLSAEITSFFKQPTPPAQQF
ncbi:MAG TPA: alpha/beta fold hydrolase [Chitinophagales bacterium]|nr:alpha/beta fold hydrolase [Chitinophagales bacterium]